MADSQKTFGPQKFFVLIFVFIIAADVAILLNIPFLRQNFGFLFLTILPGVLILQILKSNQIESAKKFVLSVGLSISFLMFFGLLINNLSLRFGYETPLATISLLTSFNFAFIVLAIIGYKINKTPILSLPNLNLTPSEKTFLIFPILFPALSIFGMHVMNTTDNNIVLMTLLFLIPTYIVFVSLFNQNFPERIYPVVIFLISISLLLLMSLRSNHIIGMDTHIEYYYFRTTLNNLYWSIFGHTTLDACLSISLLPAIYQSILNMRPEFLYKVLYSLLFSISPIVVFIISKKYIGNVYAFLASFFFMSQIIFLWTASNARTNAAILFFSLAIMVLFCSDISGFSKKLFFIIFTIACIFSHYATTYIFFFILLFSWVGMQILPKFCGYKRKPVNSPTNITGDAIPFSMHNTNQSLLKDAISLTFVALFFTVIFFWYSQMTVVPFATGTSYIYRTLTNLNQFFLLESRGMEVMTATGRYVISAPQKIKFVVYWFSIVYIAIGMLYTLVRYKRMVSIPGSGQNKPIFLKSKIDSEYFMLSLICCAILVVSIILPLVFGGYNLCRAYFQMMPLLSMFFVVGGMILANFLKSQLYWIFLKKTRKHREMTQKYIANGMERGVNKNTRWDILVILALLIPYFMCSTGPVDQMFGVPGLITLNSGGVMYDYSYVHDEESVAAKWLHNYGWLEYASIHTDFTGGRRLLSQGGITWGFIDTLYSLLDKDKKVDGYIYLRYYNVVNAELLNRTYDKNSITEYQDKFIGKSKLYNNSGSEIWK